MRATAAIGWSGVVVHFRGCSGEINRLPRAYHSGDSDEIDWILRRLQQLFPHRPRYAVGVSLGGNALLKWLGERETDAADCLRRPPRSAPRSTSAPAATISARGFNRVYTRHFPAHAEAQGRRKLRRFPGIFDERRMRAASNLYEFDDVVTAPLHGFSRRRRLLATRVEQALAGRHPPADAAAQRPQRPFPARQALPTASQVAASVQLEFPRQGGHVGFVTGSLPGQLDWLPQRIFIISSTRSEMNAHPARRNLQGLRHSRHRRQDADQPTSSAASAMASVRWRRARPARDRRRPRRTPVGTRAGGGTDGRHPPGRYRHHRRRLRADAGRLLRRARTGLRELRRGHRQPQSARLQRAEDGHRRRDPGRRNDPGIRRRVDAGELRTARPGQQRRCPPPTWRASPATSAWRGR
jgi:hypothetical protein